jgi:hypothetical protein
MLTADGEMSAEVYAAAAIKDQAKILYRDAVAMVQQSEELGEILQLHGEKETYNMVNLRTRGFFKPISSEKRGLDGKRVHCALLDEVHEHPNAVVVDKMRAGQKGCRNALQVEITNSGFDRTSICYQHHEYSERVVTGQVIDDSWFAFVCGLDEGDDPMKDESCWIKPNPNLNVSITPRYLRDQVREAQGMPAKASGVLRLNFCVWVDADNPAIDQDAWRRVAASFAYIDVRDIEPVGALDLSGVRDLTALGLLWPGDPWRAAVEFWTPEEGLQDRAKRDRVPYDVWVKHGPSRGHARALGELSLGGDPPGRAAAGDRVAPGGVRRLPHQVPRARARRGERRHRARAARPGLLQGGRVGPVDAALHRGPRGAHHEGDYRGPQEPGAQLRRGLRGDGGGPEGQPDLHEAEKPRPHRRHGGARHVRRPRRRWRRRDDPRRLRARRGVAVSQSAGGVPHTRRVNWSDDLGDAR